ncbi:MAG TPA: hypothetical protein VGH19_10340 [Verrucomicrobiae bacterium]
MTAETTRSDRYRQVAEKELVQGNPRDPVLNESIEAAADNGSDLTEEYAQRRVDQMVADEEERETSRVRRMELNRELDDQQPGTLMRTTLLMVVITAVVVIGVWWLKR